MRSWAILSQSSSSNVCMHDVPEEEEALPQRRHVLPWESLQQWYVSHFLVFLRKTSTLTASISLSIPSNSIFFLGDCANFSKWRKLNFLLHSTPLALIVFLCLRLITTWLFPILGWGNPKMLLLLSATIVFNAVWFTGSDSQSPYF